jgi:carbamoylphosphate synthase small subunit
MVVAGYEVTEVQQHPTAAPGPVVWQVRFLRFFFTFCVTASEFFNVHFPFSIFNKTMN